METVQSQMTTDNHFLPALSGNTGLRILFIHCTYKLKGGEDKVVAQEIILLRSAGYDVKLLSFSNEKNALLNLLLLPFNVFSFWKVRKEIKQFKPDVVHIHNLHFAASPSVIYAISCSKIPMVKTLHNFRLICPSATLFHNGKLFLATLDESFPFTAIRKRVYRNSFPVSLWLSISTQLHYWLGTWNRVDNYIVLSEHARLIFQHSRLKNLTGKMQVKPNFISLTVDKEAYRSEIFLYAGRLSEEKGIRTLLQVFAKSKAHLKIAGDGPLKELVVKYCSKCENILYLGLLSEQEISYQMKTCSALIFPSVWFEGMPLTLIEAFACGTPVIASRIGVMEEMILHGHNGLLFEPGNEQSLANAVEQWSRLGKNEKERMAGNAYKSYVENYTPHRNIKQLINIYRSAVDQKV